METWEGKNLDWSKIKTIFIISFLILDFYLIYEFMKMQSSVKIEVQSETEASIEKRLKADEIEYEDLPKESFEDHYLKAKPKNFTSEDIDTPILKDQIVNIGKGTILESILEEPLVITEKTGKTELNDFIKTKVLYGDQYYFWKRSEDGKTVTYTQLINGHKLFENTNGKLTFYLNDASVITSYKQTYLEGVQELSKDEKLIQPLKAIETLYTNGVLRAKSTIIDVELGYYTLVPLSDTTQVLNPAWRFIVNDSDNEHKNLYVSAFEGKIIDFNKKEKDVAVE